MLKVEGFGSEPVCVCHVDEPCPVHKVSVKPKLTPANANRFAILSADAVEIRKKEKALRDEASMHAAVATKETGRVAEIALMQSKRALSEADALAAQASMLEATARLAAPPAGA